MKSSPIVLTVLALTFFLQSLHADDASQRTAAAEEMLNAMHTEQILSKQKENMSRMMSAALPKDMSDAERQKAIQKQSDIYDSLLKWDTLKPDFIQVYSEVFTEKEMKDLIAFYKSPIGQKFIEKMPELQKKTMEIMQKRMMTVIPQLQKSLKESVEQARAASAGAKGGESPAAALPSASATPAGTPK